MIDFINNEGTTNKASAGKTDSNMDTGNIFSHLISKNKEISTSTIAGNIYSSFPKDLNDFIGEDKKPSDYTAHIILKISCSEMFFTKFSRFGHGNMDYLVPDTKKMSEDDEYEGNVMSMEDNAVRDIVRSHFRKNNRYREDLIELFEEYDGISDALIEELYLKHSETVRQRNQQNGEVYNRLNALYREETVNKEDYYHMLYSDFILIFIGIMKYFSRFHFYISFTDFKDHFLIHVWGDENEYAKLAEKMGTELMIKKYALEYEKAKWRKPKKPVNALLFNDLANEEKKEELIPKINDSGNELDLDKPTSYSKLNFNDPLDLAPHIPFAQDKSCKFQRYTIDDDYHNCPEQSIEDEDKPDANDKSCGRCSLFRNIDKLRIIFDELDELLKFNYLKKRNILTDIFVIRNFESYRGKLETKPIVFQHWNIFDHEKQLDLIYTIRNYYCETMSYYFLWLITFLKWLTIPSAFGLVIYIVSKFVTKDVNSKPDSDKFSAYDSFQIIFGGLTIIWASMFLYQWKQQEALHNYAWGTENFKHNEPDREDFIPDTNEELMFGKTFPYVNKAKMYAKLIATYFLLFVMIIVTCGLIIGSFWVKKRLGDLYPDYSLYVSIGVASANACQIKIMNFIYCFLAERLNEWENHQKEFQKINSNNIKNVLFDFMNNYFACYYILFIKKHLNISWLAIDTKCYGYTAAQPDNCVEELEIQLYTTLAIFFAFNFLELGLPFAMQVYRFKKYCTAKEINTGAKISPKDIQRNTVEYIQLCDDYNDVSGEYGEMLILFGYVMLFGVAAPVVPLLAFVLAMIEKHVDSFKLNFLVRVSILDGCTGIEMYKPFIQAFIYIGLVTNAAITCFTDKDVQHDIQQLANIFIGVIAGFFILTFISMWNILPRWFVYKSDLQDLYIAKCVNRNVKDTINKMEKLKLN